MEPLSWMGNAPLQLQRLDTVQRPVEERLRSTPERRNRTESPIRAQGSPAIIAIRFGHKDALNGRFRRSETPGSSFGTGFVICYVNCGSATAVRFLHLFKFGLVVLGGQPPGAAGNREIPCCFCFWTFVSIEHTTRQPYVEKIATD